MHPVVVRQEVLELASRGVNDCEVARMTGVPRSSVRDIRQRARTPAGSRSLSGAAPCPRCWQPARTIRVAEADYAELLGLYLGDGHIVRSGRTHRLRISLDSKYALIVDEAEALLKRGFPDNRIGRQQMYDGRMTVLSLYSKHLPCLFPQHGPGPKHERDMTLERWQSEIAEHHPWSLLRGLVRSDGCSFVNRTGPYEYLSFHFCNRSDEITRTFESCCAQVGVRYRCNLNRKRMLWEIRINRRESVALMCAHVGIKR